MAVIGNLENPDYCNTDCRSETGITVGLIDSLIAISRVLAPRLKVAYLPNEKAIYSALGDLVQDSDLKFVLSVHEAILADVDLKYPNYTRKEF